MHDPVLSSVMVVVRLVTARLGTVRVTVRFVFLLCSDCCFRQNNTVELLDH